MWLNISFHDHGEREGLGLKASVPSRETDWVQGCFQTASIAFSAALVNTQGYLRLS